MGTPEPSREERSRLEVFARERDGEVSVAKAAGLLGLSLRRARRARRERRACPGDLVQMDGGEHNGFQRSRIGRRPGDGRCGGHPRCVLMVPVGDATGRVFFRSYGSETTAGKAEKTQKEQKKPVRNDKRYVPPPGHPWNRRPAAAGQEPGRGVPVPFRPEG